MSGAFFVSILALTFSLSHLCPDGWHPSLAVPKKCYLVVTDKKGWFDAELYCQSVSSDGHLTSICSAFENNNIGQIASETPGISSLQVWIGASILDQSGNFSWTDGKNCNYANWEQSQLDVNNPCVSSKATTTRKWKTEDCASQNCFICESYAATNPTTSPPVTTTTPPHVPSCPSQWTYFNETQACYRLFFDATTWSDAEETCISNGGHLTSIHSDAENQYVADIASEHITDDYWCNQTWIGMQDLKHNRQWSWSDGSPVNYFYWAPGQPDNANTVACGISYEGEHCVQILPDFRALSDYRYHWNDFACQLPMRAFVCKQLPS